jgi:hypothetical protein
MVEEFGKNEAQAEVVFDRVENSVVVTKKNNEVATAELGEKLEAAKQKWLTKKEEIEKHRTLFMHILWNKFDLGQAEKELADVRVAYEELGGIINNETNEHVAGTEDKVLEDNAQSESTAVAIDQIKEDASEAPIAKQESSNGINMHEEFIEQVRNKVKEIDDERLRVYAKHPELSGVKDLSAEIANMEKSSMDVSNDSKTEALSILNELINSFRTLYVRTWKSLLDAGSGIDQLILEVPAKDYMSKYDQSEAVKIFETLKLKMTPEQVKLSSLDPKEGENVMQWTKKITDFILTKF